MNKKDDMNNYMKVMSTIAVGTMLLAAAIFFSTQGLDFFYAPSLDQLSKFGDFYGGTLNPLLAFFAFLALLYTIKLQSEALEQSNDELELTRKELEKSVEVQREQSKSLKLQGEAVKLQSFENTFFQLIRQFNENKNWITYENVGLGYMGSSDLSYDKTTYTSNDALSILFEELESFKYNYENFNKTHEKRTSAYFGQMYQVVKFIDESIVKDKQRYINIFRAQFTKDELSLLYYHCLGNIGKRRFKSLVENYEFFEHIVLNENMKEKILKYDIKAFGKNDSIIKKYNKLSKS